MNPDTQSASQLQLQLQLQLPSARATTAPSSLSGLASSLYPCHGVGAFTLPYYRRDSKGFRAVYHQPSGVDDNYLRYNQARRTQQVEAGARWSHPQSQAQSTLAYAARQHVAGGGLLLQTSFGNAGLYESRSNVKGSTIPLDVYDRLRATNQNPFSSSSSLDANSTVPYISAADPYPNANDTHTYHHQQQQQQTSHKLFGDPLLSDPLENAMRKARTVYKRAYGLST